MADVTVKRVEDFETIFGGAFRKVRAGLGVRSFGMQILDMPPNIEAYPMHDHLHDHQEEVYIVLKGSAKLLVGDEEHELEPGVFARVGAGEKRKLLPGAEGVRVLAIGGTPGQAYTPPAISEEGAPETTFK